MEIIPAIDLKEGCCVRLIRGDFDKETVYSREPLQMALYWEQQGAKHLHLVDLDGARNGEPQNMEIIKNITSGLRIPVQLGGGIRSSEIIKQYLSAGVERVILGTAAREKPSLVTKAIREFGPERIVIGVDAREDRVALRGWLKESEVTAKELIQEMKKQGVRTFIYTDISKDGTLEGPDFDGLRKLNQISGAEIIASGGVSSVEDLISLKEIGVKQAIVGKALYSGNIKPDLRDLSKVIN
ncbi:MAG TPA: 1-(5-phosphoribosyl)-5-[(5-phosphoribosylamino)methylideneamino]imidazole-4-carboxamide isomerase [Halanaerobiales bacterium]|nr:1-(5-phosphoribosyl)-5-[(5-phosphoribosylamino)methylideneamino]imidazole-4-carboxamide isomerase [Halanaerobiales bacterium]